MNAIPTVYKDVRFRSRLEAKWAAFFDIADWDWEYEPFDLAGWIPDFYVWPHYGRQGGGWLIEVKPALGIEDFDVDRYRNQVESCGIDRCEGIGLLGATIHQHNLGFKRCEGRHLLDGCQLGWFINGAPEGKIGQNFRSSTPREYFHINKISRVVPGELYPLFLFSVAEYWEGEAMWKEAANIVQWKGATA